MNDSQFAALFAEPQEELEPLDFTENVMRNIQQDSRRRFSLRIAAGLGMLVFASLFALPLELASFISTSLTAPVIDLGVGWVGWLLMPINNTGALLLLLLKSIRTLIPKTSIRRVSLLPF
jgi:hypothetical protein